MPYVVKYSDGTYLGRPGPYTYGFGKQDRKRRVTDIDSARVYSNVGAAKYSLKTYGEPGAELVKLMVAEDVIQDGTENG